MERLNRRRRRSRERSPGPSQEQQELAPATSTAKVESCQAAVEAYRCSQLSKKEATIRIFEAIQLEQAFGTDDQGDQHRTVCLTFLVQLDDVDQTNSGGAPNRRTPEADHSSTQTQSLEAAGGDLQRSATPQSGTQAARKRARESGEGDEEAEDSSVSKRPVNESYIPFLNGGRCFSLPGGLSDLEATLLLKENYLRDVALIKARVVCHPDCPE